MTIGIVFVASRAAWITGVEAATMTSTSRCTSSIAIAFSRASSPPAHRYSMTRSRPST
jgi:hypothetical protein